MKINENIKTKDSYTSAEYIGLVNSIVESNFDNDDTNGTIEYRPDYATISENGIIALNCLNDVFVLDETDKKEIVVNFELLDLIASDADLSTLIQEVLDSSVYKKAKADAAERIEFMKNMMISNNSHSSAIENKLMEILNMESEKLNDEIKANKYNDKLIKAQLEQVEYANKVAKQFSPEEQAEITRKMADSDFNMEKMSDLVSEKYFASAKHDDNVATLVDAKNAEIADLKKYKAAIDARNVLADKKE